MIKSFILLHSVLLVWKCRAENYYPQPSPPHSWQLEINDDTDERFDSNIMVDSPSPSPPQLQPGDNNPDIIADDPGLYSDDKTSSTISLGAFPPDHNTDMSDFDNATFMGDGIAFSNDEIKSQLGSEDYASNVPSSGRQPPKFASKTYLGPPIEPRIQLATEKPSKSTQGNDAIMKEEGESFEEQNHVDLPPWGHQKYYRDEKLSLEKYNLALAPSVIPPLQPNTMLTADQITGIKSQTIRAILGIDDMTIPGVMGDGVYQDTSDTAKNTSQVSRILARYWTLATRDSQAAARYLNKIMATPIIKKVLQQTKTNDSSHLRGVYAFRQPEQFNQLLSSASDYAKHIARYVYGLEDSESLTQIIALAHLDIVGNNQPVLPAKFRERVLVFCTRKMPISQYLSWIEQAVNTGNTVAQFLLVKNLKYLIQNEYADLPTNSELPSMPVSRDNYNVIVNQGPFTIAHLAHCLYYLTLPSVPVEIYQTFVKESGLQAVPAYLTPVQIVINKDEEQGIARKVKFMMINMEIGLGLGDGTNALLDNDINGTDRIFYDLMRMLNMGRLFIEYLGTHDFEKVLKELQAAYLEQVVVPNQGMPWEHQEALEYFLGRINCMSLDPNSRNPICAAMPRIIVAMRGDGDVDLLRTGHYRMAWLISTINGNDLLKLAVGNTYLLAYALQQLQPEPTLLDQVMPLTPGGHLIKTWYAKLKNRNGEIAQKPPDLALPPFPIEPCSLKDVSKVYISIRELPHEEFAKLSPLERLLTMAGFLLLATDIGQDDLHPGHYFNFDMELSNQLDEVINSYCRRRKQQQATTLI